MYRSGFALALLGLTLSLWSLRSVATQAVTVLDLEGNPTCNSLALNSVLQLSDNSPPAAGVPKTISASGGPSITYTLDATRTGISLWNVVGSPQTPINFVIAKSQGNTGARVFHFSPAGALQDSLATARGTITQISFCYGLAMPANPGGSQTLPDCSEINDQLDETGIACPTDGSRRVIYSFDPDAPNWNVTACTCNATLTKCNPDASFPQDADACPSGATKLPRVPVQVEAVEDPFVCSTIGGTRTCTCVDQNKALAGCQ
jgi:hypothetical protein